MSLFRHLVTCCFAGLLTSSTGVSMGQCDTALDLDVNGAVDIGDFASVSELQELIALHACLDIPVFYRTVRLGWARVYHFDPRDRRR